MDKVGLTLAARLDVTAQIDGEPRVLASRNMRKDLTESEVQQYSGSIVSIACENHPETPIERMSCEYYNRSGELVLSLAASLDTAQKVAA